MTEYATITTNAEEIEQLLDFVWLRGTGTDGTTKELVEDCILHFEDGEVSVSGIDPMASIWFNIRGPFEGIQEEGDLVIGDIEEFRDYIERFGEETTITTGSEGGIYRIQFNDGSGKEGSITATDESEVGSLVPEGQDLPVRFDKDEDYPGAYESGVLLDTWFRCDVDYINDAINDGDVTEVREYPIYADNADVSIRVGDDDGWIETTFTAEDGEGEASSVYAYGMDNIFRHLDGYVTFYFVQDGVSWIRQEEDDGDTDYSIDYMLAEDI